MFFKMTIKKTHPEKRKVGIADIHVRRYGTWIIEHCMITKNGFRSFKVPYEWEGEISNNEAYELYLKSLKKK
jgi:hypothetical protein